MPTLRAPTKKVGKQPNLPMSSGGTSNIVRGSRELANPRVRVQVMGSPHSFDFFYLRRPQTRESAGQLLFTAVSDFLLIACQLLALAALSGPRRPWDTQNDCNIGNSAA